MLEPRQRLAGVVRVRVRHGRVLAHDVHGLDPAGMDRVDDLDHGEARPLVELLTPERFQDGAVDGVADRVVVGEDHRDQAGVGSALDVVLAAQRVQAGAGAADMAAHHHQEIRQRALSVPWTCCETPMPQNTMARSARAKARATSRRVSAGMPHKGAMASGG